MRAVFCFLFSFAGQGKRLCPGPCLAAVLLSAGLLIGCGAASALAQGVEYSFRPDDNTLRVGFWDDWEPYSYRDKASGEAVGMLIDIWNRWARLADIKVAYQAMGSRELFDALKDGRIDVILGVPDVHGSLHELAFGTSLGGISARVYYRALASSAELPLEEALELAPLGVVADSSLAVLMARHFPGLRLRTFPGTGEMVEAILAGEIQAFITWQMCAECFPELQAQGVRASRPLFTQIIHPLMLGSRPGLVKMVNDNFNKISRMEMEALRRPWNREREEDQSKQSSWPYFLLIIFVLCLGVVVGRSVVTNSRAYKEIYNARRRDRNLLRIFRAMPGKYFLLTLNRQGEIIEVSPEARAILGYSPEEMLGPLEAFLANVPDNSRGIFHNGVWDFDRPDAFLTLLHKNGSSRRLLFLFAPQGCPGEAGDDVYGLALNCQASPQPAGNSGCGNRQMN